MSMLAVEVFFRRREIEDSRQSPLYRGWLPPHLGTARSLSASFFSVQEPFGQFQIDIGLFAIHHAFCDIARFS